MIKIERAYVIALTIIAATITVSQFISQRFILTGSLDATIVNISGRQRMLSQKICKAAIRTVNTNDSSVFEKSRIELVNAAALWAKSHRALQYGDSELGIESVDNSDTVLYLFETLNPSFEKISRAATALAADIRFRNRKQAQWQNYLEQIFGYEDRFLSVMDDITFQYDKEARQKMNNLSGLEYMLYASAILLLLLEAFLIFKPALKKLKFNTQKLIENEKKMEELRVERKFLNELQAKNKELEQFVYITSHDLQEPLNSIISFSKLLKRSKKNLDEVGNKSLEIIERSAYRMKDFITSLLEYSRIGREKEKSSVDIKKLLNHLKTDLYSLIKKKGATVTYIGPDLTVKAFENDLIKLFQNLIANGIKYQKKAAKPVITIDAREQKEKYTFSVKDNGIGIKQEYFDKIFEIFQRLHTRDKYEGTGIGLSYCKKIVELHKGKIWLDSEAGKGTTFYFTISK